MSKKRRNRHKTEHKEAQFDFDDAKELTVGEAMRKNEEVEAGVLPGDSILDKYVKQHKELKQISLKHVSLARMI